MSASLRRPWPRCGCGGDGPPFSKAGLRIVVYDIQDLNEWLRETRRKSTRAAGSHQLHEV
jgi:hypothetical protein